MTHITLTLDITHDTKQFHIYLVLNLSSLSTMTSMSPFVGTVCSMDNYVKTTHIY
jgi:hypothetical protein